MKDLKTRIAEKFANNSFEKEYHRTAALYRLSARVLLLRKQRGLTQKELADKVGTTQAVISRLESASVKPSMETIIKIAEALDAVVNVELLPIETVRRTDKQEMTEEKKQDANKGILYYDFERGTLGWDEKWVSSKDPTISGISKGISISAPPHKIRIKNREFA
jgi:transcriptional regulator with XRE-family HTH domain